MNERIPSDAEISTSLKTTDTELLRLRQQTIAEINALRAEIERLTEMKERTRADLRRLFEDCLARLGRDSSGRPPLGEQEPPRRVPEMDEVTETEWDRDPYPRLPQGMAGDLLNLAKRRLPVAGGWDQAPMLVILALIILQQLVPVIQRMSSLG
jgi:hypothetical protein